MCACFLGLIPLSDINSIASRCVQKVIQAFGSVTILYCPPVEQDSACGAGSCG